MPSVHDLTPDFKLFVNKAGIRNFQVPCIINLDARLDGSSSFLNSYQRVIARASCYAALPENQKGVHMSRFAEVLLRYSPLKLDNQEPVQLLQYLSRRVESEFVYLKLRLSPIVQSEFTLDFIDSNAERVVTQFPLQTSIPMTYDFAFKKGVINTCVTFELQGFNVCPCALQEGGGRSSHAQRALLRVSIDLQPLPSILLSWNQLFHEIWMRCFSSPIGTVLKRPQETSLIAHGFQNPMFVEDSARAAAELLNECLPQIPYSIVCDSEESIHPHNAVAVILNGLP